MKLSECVPGVRVAVYGRTGNFLAVRGVGTIEAVTADGLVRFYESRSLARKYRHTHGGWDLTLVHHKQLRKLKPKEKKKGLPPKEVWVNYYHDIPYSFTDKRDADCSADFSCIERLNSRAYKYVLAEEQE